MTLGHVLHLLIWPGAPFWFFAALAVQDIRYSRRARRELVREPVHTAVRSPRRLPVVLLDDRPKCPVVPLEVARQRRAQRRDWTGAA